MSLMDLFRPKWRHSASRWLTRAEKLAGLPKLSGGLWHCYRRAFATELRSAPVQDVAELGGLRSIATVQEIYQQAEASGVLDAITRIGNGGQS